MTITQPAWVYRFEAVNPSDGLWYNDFNEWVFDETQYLFEGSQLIHAPMDYDPRYHKDSKTWHSSAPTKTKMKTWFRYEDIERFTRNGYVLYSYLATEYIHYDAETCFIKDTAIDRILLDPYEIYKIGVINVI